MAKTVVEILQFGCGVRTELVNTLQGKDLSQIFSISNFGTSNFGWLGCFSAEAVPDATKEMPFGFRDLGHKKGSVMHI